MSIVAPCDEKKNAIIICMFLECYKNVYVCVYMTRTDPSGVICGCIWIYVFGLCGCDGVDSIVDSIVDDMRSRVAIL